jgi:Zn-finger nucleic acid-binding protein
VNCTNCGAPLNVAGPGSYLYCRYCSSLFFPTATRDNVDVLGIETSLRCPVCADVLVTASVSGIHVRYCRQCHGVLVDQRQFAEMVAYLRAQTEESASPTRPLNRNDLKRSLHCPLCQQRLDTHPYYGPGNIVIDVCFHCPLVWLDGGELNAISNAPKWQYNDGV